MATDVERTWPSLLTELIAGRDLDRPTTAWAMDRIMAGEATPAQIAGFIIGLRSKGESDDEMRGLAEVMLEHAHRIEIDGQRPHGDGERIVLRGLVARVVRVPTVEVSVGALVTATASGS